MMLEFGKSHDHLGKVVFASREDAGELNGAKEATNRHTFGWEPCNGVMVSAYNDQPGWTCGGQWPQNLEFSVSLDKPLHWDEDKREWRWHKTWRLPEICVRVSDKDYRPNTEVWLSIVCVGSHANELDEVGLSTSEGEQRCAVSHIVDGECRFTRLRLIGTSNTHGGRRFHFLVCLMQRDSLGNHQVIAALISSAFSVYSRKDADKKRRKSDNQEAQDGAAFAPFSPELFTRVFVKKISNHQGQTLEEPIENSWAGLMRYFQAPNIRFKSRHPLLLATRFSSVVVILRDSQHFPTVNEYTIRNFLCATGFPPNCRTPNCLSCYVRRSGPVDSGDGTFLAPWHVSMREDFARPAEATRWITEHLSCVRSSTLGFIQEPSMLPERFVITEDLEEIKNLYIKMYSLEYAAKGSESRQQGGRTMKVERDTSQLSSLEVSEQVNMKRSSENGFGGQNPQSQLAFRQPQENKIDDETIFGEMNAESNSNAIAQFAEFFVGLHTELRQLLNAFTSASSLVVTECSEDNVQTLRNAYFNFTEALAVHSQVEDTVLFPELTKRVPGVAEAYNYDHYKESAHLAEIHEAINSLTSRDAAELFLKISGFAALDTEHMEKEEEHLLPYFVTLFSEQELLALINKAESVAAETRIGQNMDSS